MSCEAYECLEEKYDGTIKVGRKLLHPSWFEKTVFKETWQDFEHEVPRAFVLEKDFVTEFGGSPRDFSLPHHMYGQPGSQQAAA
jgi:hypothetical protein